MECDDSITTAAEMLRTGKIIAIKGLGGFHLACQGDSDNAVRRLRDRKRRDAKPFALMAANLDQVRAICHLTPEAEALLTGPLRPIVILRGRPDGGIATPVAEGYDTLGIMLPYTPLHHLLFSRGLGPLVMTSGNYSEEPLVKDNDAAVSHLSRIADALLLHNRSIERRVDDSVVQVAQEGRVQIFRRARGYAPRPMDLLAPTESDESTVPGILAVGGELKNTICLACNGRALLSEHIGDLKDGRVYRHFIDTINHHEQLFDVDPELIVADMHPQYLSTHYALKRHRGELPGRRALPIVRVQHHHAHLAACLVDNARMDPVIGVVCDGTGYGDDGAVWGCEILQAHMTDYRRLGHLRYIPLVGGDVAAVETYRPAVAALFDAFAENCHRIIRDLSLPAPPDRIRSVLEILSAGVDCPQGGSLGRWFDAVACMCGLVAENRCEGEAPMKLEAAIREGVKDAYSFAIRSEGPFLIDLRPMAEGLAFDLIGGLPAGEVAAKFHNTVVRFLAAAARKAAMETGINVVALSGGCFANRYLTAGLVEELSSQGIEVLTHRDLPCNDGSIALGQVAVALTRARAERDTREANLEDKSES
jgi:hydrogenase maturation protein HypF